MTADADPRPLVVVVMGVSGAGKSTVGRLLAGRLGWDFCDSDDLHTARAVAKMESAQALSDDDRRIWLGRINAWVAERLESGRPGVIAASVLKRSYRNRLQDRRILLVYLTGPREVLGERLAARRGHFMPVALLPSQLAIAEPPSPEERHVLVDISPPPSVIVDGLLAYLRVSGHSG